MKELVYENCIVRVHIPDLTKEEREKRINAFKEEALRFMKTVESERNRK